MEYYLLAKDLALSCVMGIRIVAPEIFLTKQKDHLLIDVRSPSEFQKSHIPGSINVPLLDDSERAHIGTLYKQQGKYQAILEGLGYVGPKMQSVVESLKQNNAKTIGVYCWRGGLRSQAVAQLLSLVYDQVNVLEGGYKNYRAYGREILGQPWLFKVIAGRTGSGKTEILQQLSALGEQIIDLEAIANHKGSAFGGLLLGEQPSSEQAQNRLVAWLQTLNPERIVWVEDESMNIGSVFLPEAFWNRLHASTLIHIDRCLNVRVERLSEEYGAANQLQTIERIQKISKKLGGQKTLEIIEAVQRGDAKAATEGLLAYYDKAYTTGLRHREEQILYTLTVERESATEIATMILKKLNKTNS
jgi:tRNA 2-selenouridine synthase